MSYFIKIMDDERCTEVIETEEYDLLEGELLCLSNMGFKRFINIKKMKEVRIYENKLQYQIDRFMSNCATSERLYMLEDVLDLLLISNIYRHKIEKIRECYRVKKIIIKERDSNKLIGVIKIGCPDDRISDIIISDEYRSNYIEGLDTILNDIIRNYIFS